MTIKTYTIRDQIMTKKVSDAQMSIGKLLDASARRDALHFAVAPVVAKCILRPGQHVGVDGAGKASPANPLGIVDPFLDADVKVGERFWLFLYPNTITSLRHVWDHPSFAQEAVPYLPANCSKEEARLREIALSIGIDYHDMMFGADDWVRSSASSQWPNYLVQQGSENWRDDFPAYAEEFWALYDVVRGTHVPEEHRESFFSCSC